MCCLAASVSVTAPTPEISGSKKARGHRLVAILLVALLVVVAFSALVLVPARTNAQALNVSSGAAAFARFSVHGPSWVTVHFDRQGSQGMRYWMDGGSGMMFNRSMMAGGGMMSGAGGSDSYSFWTWGGDFRCGAQNLDQGPGTMQVWVNMTSAIL